MKNQILNIARRVKICSIFILLIILRIPLHLLFLFSGFFPRDPNIWLFGCWEGTKFRANSKLLYLYVKDNYPDIQSIWIAKNTKLYRSLKKNNIDVVYAYALKGFIISLRAKYYFVSHGIGDMNEFASRKSVLINLSHSIYPIKDMHDTAGNTLLLKAFNYLQNPYGYLIKPDYAVTSSSFTKKATKHQFRINDNQIIITGTPKTDLLISSNSDNLNKLNDTTYSNFYATDKKRILYLPTYRGSRSFSVFNFDFDLEKLDSLLTEINAAMAFNLHPSTSDNNSLKIPDFSKFESMSFFNFKGDEINRLLKKTDLLITDYSALFADFLLYDKPIIFAKFDHAGYLKERKLYVDYDKDLPGPKAENWPALLHHMKDILYYQNDAYRNSREDLKNLIYPDLDGRARERITQYVLSLSAQ